MRIARALVSLFSGVLLWAGAVCAPAAAQTSSPVLAGIAHAAIRVSNLPRARDFYQKLGFKVAFSMSKNGQPTEVFLKINDLQFIELYPQRNLSQAVGFLHVCFQSNDIQSLNTLYRERGLSPKPVKRAGAGNLLFTMQGPEQQNIEYTQYMPGSMHSKIRGKDLGPDRISQKILGVAIPMADQKAAANFYVSKLGFTRSEHPLESGQTAVTLPGASHQQIEFVPKGPGLAFRLLFAAPDQRTTAHRLQSLGFTVHEENHAEWITDPDGNRLVFIHTAHLGK